jgi:hypothetical protein
MSKIPTNAQITFLGLPEALNKALWNKGMYSVKSLQKQAEAELRSQFTKAQVGTIISAMAERGIGPKGYVPAPSEPETKQKIKTITLPVGGDSKLGKQVLALMKASGVKITQRLTKQYQEKVAETLEAALAVHKEKSKRPQPKKASARRANRAP